MRGLVVGILFPDDLTAFWLGAVARKIHQSGEEQKSQDIHTQSPKLHLMKSERMYLFYSRPPPKSQVYLLR